MIIYKITNMINGKIYVGQDSKNDKNYIGSGSYILRAIKKYGKENFIKETLEECISVDMLNEREIYWIKKLNSRNPEIGYNLRKGGNGNSGRIVSIETKKRMSECRRNISNETREKMSKSKKGKKLSEEHKQKIRNAAAQKREKKEKEISLEKKKLTTEERSAIQRGIRRSDETRKKISEALRRRKGKGIRNPVTNKITFSNC